jgi:2-phospho-L-lactate guanylyltransferase
VKRPAWAIVPAKSLARGKSRLRPVLADDERAAFARALLEHTLGVLGAAGLDGVLVCTDGDDVAELAAARGAEVLRDGVPSATTPTAGVPATGVPAAASPLARVVDGALRHVEARGAATAIVFMADLPRLDAANVATLLAALDAHDVAIVRDHLGHHTNALALSPPTAFATSFGTPRSFDAHCASARAAGLRVAVVDDAGIAFDVDGPSDHALMTRPAGGNGSAGRA